MKAIQYACFGGLGVLENGLKAGEITSFVAAVLPLRPAVEAYGRWGGREVRGPNGVRVRRGTGLPDGRTSPGELIAEGHSACFSKVLANMPSEAGQQNREVDIGASMFDLDQVIRLRHSTRMFLPQQPVPRELIDEARALAVRAPSDYNIQPWQMVFASGAARDRLPAALLDEARKGPRPQRLHQRLQQDSPDEIGTAVAQFVRKLRAWAPTGTESAPDHHPGRVGRTSPRVKGSKQ